MLGRTQTSRGFAAACAALALAAAACSRDSATTGPTGLQSKDFAANLRLVSGDQQPGPITASLPNPIVVRVVDAGGQPVQGATVTFAVRAGGGFITPAANVSGTDGLVTAIWTMGNTVGAAKAVATLTNVFVLDSTVFTATATTGAASKFTKVSGDNQTTNATHALGAPLVVKVQDAAGNNLSGVKVTWTPAATNGSVTFVVDTTAVDGTAQAAWKLGASLGLQSLTASIPGGGIPLTFSATATADTSRVLTVTSSLTSSTISTLAGTITATVKDSLGNPISGAAITWNDSLAGGGSMSPAAGVTNASGVATSQWTLGRRVGGQAVRLRLTGRPETALITSNATVSLTNVNAGNFSSCGIATDGTAMCWGYGADGQLGKLSNLKNTNALSTSVSTADTLVGPFLTFRDISVGKNHTCGVTIGRDLYCWGSGNSGQLGGGSPGGTPSKWKSDQAWVAVSAGEFNTCALTPAGAAYCSGLNDQGQLGNGTVSPAPVATPTQVVSAGIADTLFSIVAVGQSYVCAIPRAPGTLVPRCWGFNTSGQVGDGTGPGTSHRTVPTPVTTGGGLPTAYDSTSLVAGNSHACAIAAVGGTVGAAYCWGGNGFGQLGVGLVVNQNKPTLVPGFTFVQLTAGAYHTCGLGATGVAYCWGRNNAGQLGNNSITDSNVPVLVSTGVTFRSISAGELFTCGVVGTPAAAAGTIATAADVYCWGDNEYGQLGNTTIPAQNGSGSRAPIKISFIP